MPTAMSSAMYRAFAGELQKIAEAVVSSVKDLKRNLQPGDILVTTMNPRKDWGSMSGNLGDLIFRMGSRGIQGDYTHVGMYVGDGRVVEMRDRMHNHKLENSLRNLSAKVVRPEIPARARQRAAQRMKDLSHEMRDAEYSSPTFLARMIAANVLPKKIMGDGMDEIERKALTCSGIVAHAYGDKVDFSDGKKGPGYVMPKDILRSNHTKVVATYDNPRRSDDIFAFHKRGLNKRQGRQAE